MRELRLQALACFQRMKVPSWGPSLEQLDLERICFYHAPFERPFASWDAVPESVKQEYQALGIPMAEQHALAGVGTQYESELLFKQLKHEWAKQGVIFCSMDEAVVHHADLVKRYFQTVVLPDDNIFAALNGAVWSGGSFVYVPDGVQVQMPISTYFRMHQELMGQFERTLIIAGKNSRVHYLEGCSAQQYKSSALHAAVVEIVVGSGAQVRYTTIQNWSPNVYNLVTKRAVVAAGGNIEWIDANIGSAVTMKYPCVILQGERARGSLLSLALARAGQVQDTGGKFIHAAPHTVSHLISRACVREAGSHVFRALVRAREQAAGARSFVQCDTLLLGAATTGSDVHLSADQRVEIGHEATVSALDEQHVFYLATRLCGQQQARSLLVQGFVSFLVDELPFEYALELQRLMAFSVEQP